MIEHIISTGLPERLKQRTVVLHDRMDSLDFFLSLRAGTLPRNSIVSFLRCLSIVHAVLERSLSEAEQPEILDLARSVPGKLCKRRSNNPSLKRPDNLVAPE